MKEFDKFADEVVSSIKSVIGLSPVSLHEPVFNGNEQDYLQDCLRSTYVSSVGVYVDKFEADLANFTGVKYAVATVNGTAALHVALLLAGVKRDDEVLTPAMTFVATANAVSYCGATPHFIDIKEEGLGVDVEKLRTYLLENTFNDSGNCINKHTKKIIRTIVPMHTFGHPVDMDGINSIANQFNLTVVEDAAEALGSQYHGKHVGGFGLVGALSFNGNKIITTGGGGAILTNDPILAARAKFLTTTAKNPHPWRYIHDEIGFNYRLPNINAALGCAQLEGLPNKLLDKKKLFLKYKKAFQNMGGIILMNEPSDCASNFWLQTLILNESHSEAFDLLLEKTNSSGIMTRPTWDLLSELIPYKACPRMNLSISKSLSGRIINIPSSSNLGSI